MSQQELLALLVARLEQIGVGYFVTGSWSSSLQGEPRSTHDLDVVVKLRTEDAEAIAESFDADRFYLSKAAIAEAIVNRTMFNLIDTKSGDKIDFWLLTDEPWDQMRFRRRKRVSTEYVDAYFSTPEDTILAKLRWARLSGGSRKQLNDARGVYEVQRGGLDIDYISNWAAELGFAELWEQIRVGD